jgi:hypothetical protein
MTLISFRPLREVDAARGFGRGAGRASTTLMAVAAWLSRADHDGSLAAFLKPDLTGSERTVAKVEGWILSVGGNLRAV